MISNKNGAPINENEHIAQSISDILNTPKGTRVMRRNYGSNLPNLISHPANDALKLQIIAETAKAIEDFEPRIDVSTIRVDFDESGGFNLEISYLNKSIGQNQTAIIGVH